MKREFDVEFEELVKIFYSYQMLFSLFGEIGLCVCGLLYVLDCEAGTLRRSCWFDSYIDLMELMKNDDKDNEKIEMSETAKRMYS